MPKHAMIDLETLAVTPQATILTLGAVIFDPNGGELGDELYFRLDIDGQDKLGREVDPNTVEWWAKQDAEAMNEAFSPDNRISVEEGINAFHKFAWNCDAFWSHGSSFDIAILSDIYRQLNKVTPWSDYWKIRDTRTLFDIGFKHNMDRSVGMHNALEDAKRQAIGVQNVYRQLRELREAV